MNYMKVKLDRAKLRKKALVTTIDHLNQMPSVSLVRVLSPSIADVLNYDLLIYLSNTITPPDYLSIETFLSSLNFIDDITNDKINPHELAFIEISKGDQYTRLDSKNACYTRAIAIALAEIADNTRYLAV